MIRSAEKDKAGGWGTWFNQRPPPPLTGDWRRHKWSRGSLGKEDSSAEGQGQSSPEWAGLDEAPRRLRGECQGQNPVSQVPSALCFCPSGVISLWSAFLPRGSSCLSIRGLPSDLQNSLFLKVPRVTSPGSGPSLGQPFSNIDESGGINSPAPLPMGYLPDLPCRNKAKLCSCLENPRDGGAWWAAVCGVTQSRTRLKRLSSRSSAKWDFSRFLTLAGFSSFSVPPPSLSYWLFLEHFLISDTLRDSCPWRWFQGIPTLGSQWHGSKMNEERGMR